jgi:hypothetical protein
LWAVARYDLSLSWEEFSDLTPSMFNALCVRRNLKFKYDRFANALTASAVYNVNRTTNESPFITAFDFVRDEKQTAVKEERNKIIGTIKQVVGMMPSDTPREKFLAVRERVVNSLKSQGRVDAEELWAECWPSLVP